MRGYELELRNSFLLNSRILSLWSRLASNACCELFYACILLLYDYYIQINGMMGSRNLGGRQLTAGLFFDSFNCHQTIDSFLHLSFNVLFD